ncbi:MAG: polysaccharide pyruvyl transferase family protein [Rickettsiales bacterium]
MSTRILMEGYYGKGNFGDDVLMLATYHLLRRAAPNATISIVIGDTQDDYPRSLLQGIEIERPDRYAQYDIIVHGGGGVFFDFAQYGIVCRTLELLARLIGFNSVVQLERAVRSITGLRRIRGKRRIGLGIGVGTFSKGSPRMLRSLPILAEYDALWLRDAESVTNLEPFTSVMNAALINGSDLAFMSDDWLPPSTKKPISAKPRLGIALRDWKGMEYAQLRTKLAALAQDCTLTGFIFDVAHDPMMREVLAPYPTHIWQPRTMHIHEFAAQIAAQDGLITSRAHGAICGACLSVPSVILDIEPKMKHVHAMLPHCTQLIDKHAPWESAITTMLALPRERIIEDVARNRAASHAAWEQMKRWFA